VRGWDGEGDGDSEGEGNNGNEGRQQARVSVCVQEGTHEVARAAAGGMKEKSR